MARTAKSRVKKQVPLDNQQLLTVWLFALGGLILFGGLWAWYSNVHRSTYGVFWDTIDNNLNIHGVTRSIEQDNGGSKVSSKLQIALGAENVARGLTTITQPNASGGKTVVVTETLGTPTNNFARYLDIQSSAKPDISSIKNVWSRESLFNNEQQNQSVFAEGLFSSVPFANLNLAQRLELVKFMKDNKVYEVDYRGAKVVERAGKQGYEYEVVVNLEGYIGTLKKIDEMMNLGQLKGVDPAAYAGAEPAQLRIVSSINGRQLLEVTYSATSRTETYSSYGANIDVDIPQTNLLRPDLEKKVQTIFTPTNGS